MKISQRSRWMILFALLTVLSVLLLSGVSAVRATVSEVHTFNVLLRVESELMQKTPAGQHYEALLWKHTAEICRIMSDYPENNEKVLYALQLYAPALEALVDGKGENVRITTEQVEILKEQLDFYSSVGSPALREDIEKERQLLQLDRFVGMTMNEAWDTINSAWVPDSTERPLFVPESEGKWAYYIHNGIYLEYPGNYYVQESGTGTDTVYFVPSSNVPEQWNPCVIKVRVWNVPVDEKDSRSPYLRHQDNIVWENSIQNSEFSGIEFISSTPEFPVMDLHAYQYNEENQLAIDIWVFVNENPQLEDSTAYAEMINQRYEYFQHMVNSLRVQPQ